MKIALSLIGLGTLILVSFFYLTKWTAPPTKQKGVINFMQENINPGCPWPAIDRLGRKTPLHPEVGPERRNKFVGIFYFLWSGYHDSDDNGPYDIHQILSQHPDALNTPTSPPWGPFGAMHFWGEPLFGYYRNADPWVLRRHAHLLADAGIDTLIFDTTNRVTYKDVYMALCEVFTQVRGEGGRTPQISFMVNTEAGATAQELFNDLYRPGLYRDLWFHWEGKPLLICDPKEASKEVREFFTLRKAHWPFEQVNTPYAWHWEAAYPQHYGYTDDPDVPEQVNVAVAQNLRAEDGIVTNMSRGDARGRSFHDGKVDRSPGAVNHGFNIQEQWEHALKLDPPFIMVTGWNEWIAGRFGNEQEPVMFVDQYDQEHSRDIEMVKGLHEDNYYYQLVSNVRRFKGVPAIPPAGPAKTIELSGPFSQWREVLPSFSDPAGETIPRNHPGVARLHYTNMTGRNEFRKLKVSHDAENLYFYARTEQPVSPFSDPGWMMLLIGTNPEMSSGWEGFDFIVNRQVKDRQTTCLERNTGGWNWQTETEISYRVEGCELHLAIPLEALGLAGRTQYCIDFKWADNLQAPGDPMDFYVSGDCAPGGRFRYRYEVK